MPSLGDMDNFDLKDGVVEDIVKKEDKTTVKDTKDTIDEFYEQAEKKPKKKIRKAREDYYLKVKQKTYNEFNLSPEYNKGRCCPQDAGWPRPQNHAQGFCT